MGITGRAVLTKQAQLVGDVTRDPDYIKYHPFTSTELTVPVIIDEKVDYVINLEHPDFHAFDEEDKQVLKALAAQTAIALQNARKHESLKQANDLVKKKTTCSGSRWSAAFGSTTFVGTQSPSRMKRRKFSMIRKAQT